MNSQTTERGSAKPAVILAVLLTAAAAGFYALTNEESVERTVVADQAGAKSGALMAHPVNASHSLPTVDNMLGQLEERLQRDPDDAKGWNLLGKSYEYLGRHEEAQQAFERAKSLGYTDADSQPAKLAVVKGTVRIDQAMIDNVSMTDTVFVFAKAVNGPRMPLAVLRREVREMPFEFELNDSMAMSPEAKLSGFRNVIVGARISTSGSAAASAGDLEGYSGVVEVGNDDDVTITIGQAVIR